MARTAADILIESLHDWGVEVVVLAAAERFQDAVDAVAGETESLARGEPNPSKIAWTVLSDKVRELI